jgi:small multidrug resistance family-3 protein
MDEKNTANVACGMPGGKVIVLIKPIAPRIRLPPQNHSSNHAYFIDDSPMKTFLLYALTAVAEIVGCYLPWRWLKEGGSIWLLVPGALSLALFAWLLTLHGTAAGRVYAAYGGVYVAVAIAWLWCVDKVRPTLWDAAGVAFTLAGMAIIAFQPRI